MLNTKLNYLERQLIGLWAVSNQIVYCLDNSLAYQKLIFITKLYFVIIFTNLVTYPKNQDLNEIWAWISNLAWMVLVYKHC